MKSNVTTAVEAALTKLDGYNRVLRRTVLRIYDEYDEYSCVDQVSSAVANRAMQLIYGFITLIRSDNYSTAHHLIRIHLDNYLRYFALWLSGDPQELAKMIINGQRLNSIQHTTGKTYTDTFLMKEAAKQFPWIATEYDKLSGYIHFSQAHVINATELVDENRKLIGFHAIQYDMLWNERDRLAGIDLMEKITNRIVEKMVEWCEGKERVATSGQKINIPVEYLVGTAPLHIAFEFEQDGEKRTGKVMPFDSDEGKRFRIKLNTYEALIVKAVAAANGKVKWVQETRQGVEIYEVNFVQRLGEAMESAGIWKKPDD